VCTASSAGVPGALCRSPIVRRCPNDDACRTILAATGPLAATSANISGEIAYDGGDGQEARLPDASLALLKGPTSLRRESTVIDCSAALPRILRTGALDAAAIRAALAGIAEVEI